MYGQNAFNRRKASGHSISVRLANERLNEDSGDVAALIAGCRGRARAPFLRVVRADGLFLERVRARVVGSGSDLSPEVIEGGMSDVGGSRPAHEAGARARLMRARRKLRERAEKDRAWWREAARRVDAQGEEP